MLSYVQGGLADIWKKNVLEDLEGGLLEYETVGEFLTDIKKKFGGGDEELVKVAELQRLEQGNKTMEEFVQEFRRATRGSRYKGYLPHKRIQMRNEWGNKEEVDGDRTPTRNHKAVV